MRIISLGRKQKLAGVALLITALFALGAISQSRQEIREEFHQSYKLDPTGRISLENINGDVKVIPWDKSEIKVDAVKRARRKERLDEVKIVIDASSDSISIKSDYPDRNLTFNNDREDDNPASVDYTLTVPRGARIANIDLINGNLDIDGMTGEVKASCINGRLSARGLTGRTKLSTINGKLDASFTTLNDSNSISLSSVNSSVTVTIPSDSQAYITAGTVHGSITNDFGLPVRRGDYVGSNLEGILGQGGTRIRLDNVNGSVAIRRAQDGKQLSTSTSLINERRRGDRSSAIEIDAERIASDAMRIASEALRESERERREATREAERATREAMRDAAEAQREAQREIREAQREAERELAQAARDAARATAEIDRGFNEGARMIDRDVKTYKVAGVPKLNMETFDGQIVVRSWDRPDVEVTTVRRANDDRELKAIQVKAEQRGDEIIYVVEYEPTSRRFGGWGSYNSPSASFEINVPRKSNLRLKSGDGRVSVSDIDGEADLSTGDGAVDVRGFHGRMNAQTGDGAIRVEKFDGEIDATTGDGRISLEGRFRKLIARTGDGTISLSLASDTNANIDTDGESVTSDGFAIAEDPGSTRRLRRWRVGNGGPTFSLRTGDGRIVIRRSDN